MIKSFTLFTNEVDDTEAAVDQLRLQLAENGELLANTVGVISCYADFVTSGTYKAICDALPFEVAGTTTLANTVRGTHEDILLTIMVLTSDDVCFSTGVSAPITGEDEKALNGAYQKAAGCLGAEPKLILSFAPLLMNVGGDFFARALNEISGGVPNFGTLSVDHNEDYHESRVLCAGEAYPDCYAFILIGGNISPKYYVASISNENIFHEKGVVTASVGNQLQTVNNMPVGDYLESLGLKKSPDGSIVGINSFPFIMDLNDGMMPIVRVMFALTPEGYAVCGGNIPVGATLSVGSIDAQEVVATTERRLHDAIANGGHDAMLIYSCVGRYFSLGYNPTSEMDKIKELLDPCAIPYHFAYSGCELCPVYTSGNTAGETMNRSHNDTLIICAF